MESQESSCEELTVLSLTVSSVRMQFSVRLAYLARNDLSFLMSRRRSSSKQSPGFQDRHFRLREGDGTLDIGPISKVTVPFAIVDDPICAILGHARQRRYLLAVLTVQI